MMDKLRNVANHTAFKIIFALIMLSFIFAGIGFSGLFSSDDGSQSVLNAAKVNGRTIPNQELDKQLDFMLSQLPSQNITAQERQQLRQDILNRNIDDILLYDFAVKQGIRVTDEQVKQEIRRTPEFQVKGKFDNQLYLSVLKNSGYSPAMYAEAIRDYLTRTHATQLIVNSDFNLPADSDIFALKNQKRTAYIGTVSPQKLIESVPEFSKEELLSYYNTHLKQYERDDMIRVEYIGISLKDLETEVKVTDKEITQYYQKNQDEFTMPERQKLSLIRVKTKDEAEAILKTLKAGGDFAQLAKEKSTLPMLRDTGGELGWYEINDDLPAEMKNLGLKKKGQLSEVIAIEDEFSIFRLDEIEPKTVRPKKEVAEQIRKQLFEQKSLDSFDNMQKALTAAAQKTPKSLEAAAKLVKMDKVEKSYWIEKQNDQFSFFTYPELNAAMNLLFDEHRDSGQVSDVIYVNQKDNQNLYLIRIADYFKKGTLPFKDIEALVERNVKNNWLEKQMKEKTEFVLSELDKGNTDILSQEGVAFIKPTVLTRHSKNIDSVLLDKIFKADVPVNGKTVYGYHNDTEKGATFFALINVENEKQPNEQEKSIYFAEKSRATLGLFLQSLRASADIKINDTVMTQ